MRWFYDHLDFAAGVAFERQNQLAEMLDGQEWSYTASTCTLTIEGQPSFVAHELGSASELSNTWLWAWAHSSASGEEPSLASVLDLRDRIAEQDVGGLAEAQFSLDVATADEVAIVAQSVLAKGPYFRVPYEHGVLFLLLVDEKFPALPAPTALAATSAIMAIAGLEHAHKRVAVRRYCESRGFTIREEATKLHATLPSGHAFVVEFDDRDRIVEVAGEL
jgi:hypothetical protein